jgi:hypothetical protein
MTNKHMKVWKVVSRKWIPGNKHSLGQYNVISARVQYDGVKYFFKAFLYNVKKLFYTYIYIYILFLKINTLKLMQGIKNIYKFNVFKI